MAEYIELGEAINLLWLFADESCASVVSDFENLLPADVAPVVHGLWDSSGRYKFTDGSIAVRRTKCGCSLHEKEYMENVWNYCPVCGSIMDLEG